MSAPSCEDGTVLYSENHSIDHSTWSELSDEYPLDQTFTFNHLRPIISIYLITIETLFVQIEGELLQESFYSQTALNLTLISLYNTLGYHRGTSPHDCGETAVGPSG